jgi:predicted dehydrogenase
MIRAGIVGFGFMGKMHFRCYKALEDVQVAAICDADVEKLTDAKGEAGNVAGAEGPVDLSQVGLYTDFDEMLTRAKLDIVSITLPTFMHADYTVKALEAGANVLCEKPMALNVSECRRMIDAAEASGRLLQIGHCIRFWPEYAKTKEMVDSGKYGKVISLSMRRLGSLPAWSWDNWLTSAAKSGGALLDLHIHDSDFVQYLFGMPRSVRTQGVRGRSGDFDHICTQYFFKDDKSVVAEGSWLMMPAFGFEMSFHIVLERATVVYDCTRQPAFRLWPAEREAFTPQLKAGDGYSREIEHFVRKVRGEDVPEVITPGQSLDSIRLVLAERRSAECGKEIKLK